MSKTVTLRIDERIYGIFQEAAQAENRTLSNLIETAALARIREQQFVDDVELAEQDLLFDPQTSGGLLIACSEDRAEELIAEARETLSTACAVVGQVKGKEKEARAFVGRSGQQDR